MEALIGALIDTKIGIIMLGCVILIAIMLELVNNKPKF